MEKLKIISNPYIKKIKFQYWDAYKNEWLDIQEENSKLLSNEIATGFFPFKVKKIVDEIIHEYISGEGKVKILFEGTEEEFDEIEALCSDEYYKEKVILESTNNYLENARDILPDIKNLFKDIRNLVYESVSDKSQVDVEFNRLTEASDDIVPICVLGNYSCGKSTFINALIGNEILPTGADPVTAKIYKIERAQHSDRATVKFKMDDNQIVLTFLENKHRIEGHFTDDTLREDLEDEMFDNDKNSLDIRVNSVLEIINDYDEDDGVKISDLINVSIPFKSGLWGETQNNFVIFDTPGSNSASNAMHLTVLKKALSELSNGIIIFISKYDNLDSMDSEDLYNEINSLKELDSRFTMIVVNQADSADIPKNHERKVLKQVVPRKLHAENILFVSSIMGLGSKNNNEFINEHCAEIFDEKQVKYSDPSSKYYKQLYNYNIMPEQIKKKSLERSSKHKDKVYANSGLYCIEDEIQIFASKYSSYNKCQQSLLFLGKIIDITSNQILKSKEEREKSKKFREESLENDKRNLINRLENKVIDSENSYLEIYPDEMLETVSEVTSHTSKEDLKLLEKKFIDEQEKVLEYDERSKELTDSVDNLKDNLVDNVKKAFKTWDMESFKAIKDTFADNAGSVWDSLGDKYSTKKEVYKAAANLLLEDVKEDFNSKFEIAKETIDNSSKNYWKTKESNIKEELSILIADSEEISEEKKKELSEIIITYGELDFENHVDDVFVKKIFEQKFAIDYILFGESDRLNITKLRDTFNIKMTELVNGLYDEIRNSHITSFKLWLSNLKEKLVNNIIDYSPLLHRQQLIIEEETRKILDLESKQHRLNQYQKEIQKMMDWKIK